MSYCLDDMLNQKYRQCYEQSCLQIGKVANIVFENTVIIIPNGGPLTPSILHTPVTQPAKILLERSFYLPPFSNVKQTYEKAG